MRGDNPVGKFIRFVRELLLRHPLPSPIVNLLLMLRWRCFIHPFASIGYPNRVRLGKYCRVGKCKISAPRNQLSSNKYSVVIEDRAFIGDGVVLSSQGGYIEIGANVSIHDYSIIYGYGGVRVGRDTRIAAASIIVSHEHVFQNKNTTIREVVCERLGVAVGRDCWLGVGCRVLGGVSIGDFAIVGAGAVVTSNIFPESIAVGVPAKFLRNRFSPGAT